MPIWDFNTDIIGELLIPPVLRQPKQLDWLSTILSPVQKLRDRVFFDYKEGVESTYNDFNIGSTYSLGDMVIWTDKCVYQAIYTTSFSGIEPNNTTYWLKTQEIFIGVDERVKYSAQKFLFEYALNKYFRLEAPNDLIYITNNFYVNASFVMANSGDLSSAMPNNSIYQTQYMNDTYTYSASDYDYTIYFPVADYTALASTANDREMIVRNFADKYNLAGIRFNILTY
jgi:hypothetical protein